MAYLARFGYTVLSMDQVLGVPAWQGSGARQGGGPDLRRWLRELLRVRLPVLQSMAFRPWSHDLRPARPALALVRRRQPRHPPIMRRRADPSAARPGRRLRLAWGRPPQARPAEHRDHPRRREPLEGSRSRTCSASRYATSATPMAVTTAVPSTRSPMPATPPPPPACVRSATRRRSADTAAQGDLLGRQPARVLLAPAHEEHPKTEPIRRSGETFADA